MTKYIALAIIAMAVVVSVLIELKTPKNPKFDEMDTARSSDSKELQQKSVETVVNAQVPTKTQTPEAATKASVTTDDAYDEEILPEEREDDMAPIVSREKLIGGADVEWIEPKAADDKFGLPPQ